MIYLRLHETDRGAIVAMCDKELLGKVFSEGKHEIDLRKYADFYKGDLLDRNAAEKMISKDSIYTANVVGKESVSICVDKGLASEGDIAMISGVPYLHIYRIA